MRLTILFLITFGTTLATNAAKTDVRGVWAAIIDRCDFGTTPSPVRLVMNVTRYRDLLTVIEVADDGGRTALAERQYLLNGAKKPTGSGAGLAKKFTGRMAVLESSDQLDQWRISEDGSELAVYRWIGAAASAHEQVLIFRRSKEVPY